jgi:hypothetical protein
MSSANSYRRKSERLRRVAVDYEDRLEKTVLAFMEIAETSDIQERRSWYMREGRWTLQTLLRGMRTLRGY